MFENRETIERLALTDAIVVRNSDWSIVDLSPGARVARGMLYVQRTYPDALSKVDIGDIDIADGTRCVLGQLHQSYSLSPEYRAMHGDFMRAHGFEALIDDEWDEEFNEYVLNALWRTAFRAWASAA